MAEQRDERDIGPGRVEAFSDGVIAIIITIMVLELHVPADYSAHGLAALWPTLLSYALSYLLVAIYWVNHHHLFSHVKRVTVTILWANIAMLFFLSLVPFFTAYVGQSRLAGFPVFCYCCTILATALCYRGLGGAIARTHFYGNAELEAFSRANGRKNMFALGCNVLATALAFRYPMLSMALVLLVALIYFVPGAWIGSD